MLVLLARFVLVSGSVSSSVNWGPFFFNLLELGSLLSLLLLLLEILLESQLLLLLSARQRWLLPVMLLVARRPLAARVLWSV